MYVLGINGGVRLGYQDISAVLMKDGEVIAAVEEERLNRIKHSPGQLPEFAVKQVLQQAGITIHDVDFIASHGSTWGDKYEEVLQGYFTYNFGHCPAIRRVHHHNAHGASAFFASGFDEALVLTIDNSGDGVSTKISHGKGAELIPITEYTRPNSLGMFYSLITQFCGFRRDTDEYKLMGLSSYGDRKKYNFDWLLKYGNGTYSFDDQYLKYIEPGQSQPTRQEMVFSDKFIEKLGKKRLSHEPLTQYQKDLAASAQQQFENVLLDLVTHHHKQTGLRKLCLSGGAALNCVANQQLMNLDFIDELYVQPASSDAGISLGAAYLVSVLEGATPRKMQTAYLGNEYSNEEIKKVLDFSNITYKNTDNPAAYAAQKVSEDKVIGWFQGKMEFGPRALGNRSILANPANAAMKDIVNSKIKFREAYRPFCPSVLEEDSELYFTGKQPIAPYMTITYDVKESQGTKIPAVTHVDNTARIQTVNQKQNPLYYQLLLQMKQITGMGVVLNTSFNRNREPMVCSPLDAISCFYGSGLDCLVMGNFVMEK